jgi:glycine cleavage system aminomethyltransferase T
LISVKNVPLDPGARLTVEGKDVGWITSATRSGDREIALAYVKRGFNGAGSKVEAISAENAALPAEIVDLPFVTSVRS